MHARARARLPVLLVLLFLCAPLLASAASSQPTAGGNAGTISLSSPALEGMLTRSSSVMVTGALSRTDATLLINGAATAVSPAGYFSAERSLAEGLNIFRLVAVTAGGRTELPLTITRDSTAPSVTILTPSEFQALPDDRVTVFGQTERGATVTVNGVAADLNVFDGSFTIRDLPLAPTGTGCLQPAAVRVEAVDKAGNSATETVTVLADQCVEHPRLTTALPTVTVFGGSTTELYVNLGQYFEDDGGADALVYSMQPQGSAGSVLSATYSARTLSLTWADPFYRGPLSLQVIARDRSGLASAAATLTLLVVNGVPGALPVLRLPAATALEPLPSGGAITFTARSEEADGGPAGLDAVFASPGLIVSIEQSSSNPRDYTVRVEAAPGLAMGTGHTVTLLSHDEAGAIARATVEVRAYDATRKATVSIEAPSPPQVERLQQGPGAALGTWLEVSANRPVPHLFTEPVTSVRARLEAQPLNGEHTYFRFFAPLSAGAGVRVVRVYASDPGMAETPVDLILTVLPQFQEPQLAQLVASTGGHAPTEGIPVTFTWEGAIPDPERTEFVWDVDGRIVSHQPQPLILRLDPGDHRITLTVTSPEGSASASSTLTVNARPALPPRGEFPWLWVGVIGLVVAGLVLGGTEIGVYFVLAALVGALIDREQREKLLTHFVRGRIYQIIQYEPGIHLSELQRKAGAARGVCAYHLHALEKAGLVKTYRDGMFLRFVATKVKIDAATYALADEEKELLSAVEVAPGISEAQLVAQLGKSPAAVARTAKKLAQSGYLAQGVGDKPDGWYPRTLGPSPAAADGEP